MKPIKIICAALVAYSAQFSFAQAEISVKNMAVVEIEETIDGETITKRIKADKVNSGGELIFLIHLLNSGDEAGENLVIDNDVPSGTVINLTSLAATAALGDLSISVDGNAYHPLGADIPAQDIKKLRWVIERLDANSNLTLEYKVQVN